MRTIFFPAISHVTRLLRLPNHAKMGVAWRKTVQIHKLPRLILAAKCSRGANFFHPSIFPRYTSFTAPQPRKNGHCLAKNSQNKQFATLNFGCKKFARRELFSSQPFPMLHVFTASQPRKSDRCLAKNSQNTQFATFNFGCKKLARRKLFSSQPFSTLHVFYGVPTTKKWPLSGQKQSKHTIGRVQFRLKEVRAARTFFILRLFPRYRSFMASQPRKNGRCWAKKKSKDTIGQV